MNKSRSSRGKARNGAVFGSISARKIAVKVDFAEPCSPERTSSGYGPFPRIAASSQATASTKSESDLTFRNWRNVSIEPGKELATASSRQIVGTSPAARQQCASLRRLSRSPAKIHRQYRYRFHYR